MINILELKIKIWKFINKVGLTNKNFTIVSNNCWGGYVYQEFDMKYNTPFIGLFIFSPDYIKLLKRLEYYISQSLTFIKFQESKYYDEIKAIGIKKEYPVGKLDDVEIHFLHYKSKSEAEEKWYRRVKRINYENVLFKFSENYSCTDNLIKEFIKLDYPNKICFTRKNYNDNCVIKLKEFEHSEKVTGEWSISSNYIKSRYLLNSMYRK